MIPHQTGRVTSGDASIFYRRLGRSGGVPVLLVHGLSYFSYDWLPIAQKLATGREVIAMDMRGFGDSAWSPAQDYAIPTMAADIVSLLDHLGWHRVVLSAHSMGGRSATYAAAKNADRFEGLVLVDFSPETAPAGARRVAHAVANLPERFDSIDDAMRQLGDSDRARVEAYVEEIDGAFGIKRDTYFADQFRRSLQTGQRPSLGVDLWQLIREVRCSILSLRGARSDMYAPETIPKMKAANPRLQVVEIDAGHDIGGDNPEAYVAAVESFLSELSVPDTRPDA